MSAPPRRAGRKLALGLATAAVLASLLMLAAELWLRLAFGENYGQRPVFWLPGRLTHKVPNRDLDHTYYGPDYAFHIRTDADGYRLGAAGAVGATARRVLFLGDSFTFGWGVDDEQTFASIVDQALAAEGDLRVVNLGVPAYGTLEYARYLRGYLQRHGPRRVAAIYVFHHFNDEVDNAQVLLLRQGYKKLLHEHPGRRRSSVHLLNYVDYWLHHRHGSAGPGAGDPPEVAYEDQRLRIEHLRPRDNLPGAVEVAEGWTVRRSELERVLIPYRQYWSRGDLPQLSRALISQGIRQIHQAAAGGSFPTYHVLINAAPAWYAGVLKECFYDAGPDPRRHFFLGMLQTSPAEDRVMLDPRTDRHFTVRYNRHFAQALLRHLRQQLLRAAPRPPRSAAALRRPGPPAPGPGAGAAGR